MTTEIYINHYILPEVRMKEALGYAGAHPADKQSSAMLGELALEYADAFMAKAVYRILPIRRADGDVLILDRSVRSRALSSLLKDCSYIALLVATVGLQIDRLVMKNESCSPARALLLSALGSERAERAADAVTEEIRAIAEREGFLLTRRFSPGYSDLPLDFQREIFALLKPSAIGVSLGEGLLMTPKKTVSAVIGLKNAGMKNE